MTFSMSVMDKSMRLEMEAEEEENAMSAKEMEEAKKREKEEQAKKVRKEFLESRLLYGLP